MKRKKFTDEFNKNAKQLKDCWLVERTWSDRKQPFSFNSNRFSIFDKDGHELNSWHMRKIENVLKLPVLEQTLSNYEGYGVGFTTLHIKLMFSLSPEEQFFKNKHFTFGMTDRRL